MKEHSNDLNEAIKSGELSRVKSIVENSKSLFESYKGVLESPMYFSARYGNKEITEYLFSVSKLPIDTTKSGYETVLTVAAGANKIELANWLLGEGANVNGLGINILSPLMTAVMGGHFEMVKLLIEQGANVNRMHIRTGLLPLDYAKSRGFKEIEAYLIQNGAKGHYILPEWVDSNKEGNGVLEYVTLRLGKILPVDIPAQETIKPISLKLVPANSGKNRVLFTFGLFAHHKPSIELFIVLPQYWNFYNTEELNQFPINFLSTIVFSIKNGFQIKEGDYLLKTDQVFVKLKWPDKIAGFLVTDIIWKTDMNEELAGNSNETRDTVILYTLLPIKSTKSGFSKQSVEKARQSGWTKLTLPI